MKLLRYGKNGYEKPGLLDHMDQIRDLSGIVSNLDAQAITPAGLKKLRAINPESLPLVKGKPRLGVPYTGISKYVAVGLNYSDHAAEAGMPVPSEPILFTKATTSITGPNDPVVLPKDAPKGDWEVELAIVMGTTARYVPEERALDYIAGYCVANDVSERSFQLERGSQWDRGKGCDTFGPLGPYLVTTDEIPNPQALDMWLDLNGQRMQTGNTRTMIFGAAYLVSYISRFMTLLPGDVMTLGLKGLGEQRQEVRAYTPDFWKTYP
ncbi:MAG: fumarylacetoacetate hydrolase family protein [Burkholderiales bacterium]